MQHGHCCPECEGFRVVIWPYDYGGGRGRGLDFVAEPFAVACEFLGLSTPEETRQMYSKLLVERGRSLSGCLKDRTCNPTKSNPKPDKSPRAASGFSEYSRSQSIANCRRHARPYTIAEVKYRLKTNILRPCRCIRESTGVYEN